MTDDDVPALWRELDLPGLADVHVHFLPEPVMRRVWQHFAQAGPLIGRDWPIHYPWPDDERVAHLEAMGVRHFTALPYAHRPGIAEYLNDWAADFAWRTRGCLSSATFYPEPEAGSYVAERIAAGAKVFKVHVQVGDFDPRDRLLDPVWGALADAGTPVVVHAGSGPVANAHTGPGPMADVLARHPQLVAVMAHLGAPEYADFVAMAEKYDRVHLDTTMAFTPFFEAMAPFQPQLLPRLRDLGPKVLLGSDFPNIPYAYVEQLSALVDLGLGEDWLRAVLWHNMVRLFDLPPAPTSPTEPTR